MLRALRVIAAIGILNRQLRDDFRGKVAVYVGATVALVGFTAALAVLDAEREAPGATITDFGEAAWWTITTISGVGYGDRYPVTVEGRLVAATLMITGIALLGVVTATIASWFVENLRATSDDITRKVEAELAESERDIEADITAARASTSAELRAVLAELRAVSTRLDALERPSDRSGA